MRIPVRVLVISTSCAAIGAVLLAETLTIDFERDAIGQAPKGFSFALTGRGRPGAWTVRRDDPAHGNVLAQTDPDTTDYRFPLAVYDAFTAADVELSVQFKPIAGKQDQGAGLVWRYRDQDNYYVTRCNALEDNCTIYRVVNGRRQAFQNHRTKVPSNVWQTLRVQASGDHFVVTYDGTQVLDAHDATLRESGKVGLWTKADSIIYFDKFSMSGK